MEHYQLLTMESVPQMCRICFATDSKMFSMISSNDLNAAYESVTGIMTEDEEHLPHSLCSECAAQLMVCARFRRRGLRAHSLLVHVFKRHHRITVDLVKSTMNENYLTSDTNTMNSSQNDDVEKANKRTDGEKDKQNKDLNMYEKNNIKIEIDDVDHVHIDGEDRTNQVEIPVMDIKDESDDLNIQEDFNACSSNLGEDIGATTFVNKYDMMNEFDDEGLSDSDKEIDVTNIIAKNDMINRDDLSVCSFTSDEVVDIDIETIDNGIVAKEDVEITTNRNFVYSARLYEDIVNYVLKKEYGYMVNSSSFDYKYSRDFLDSQHSFLFVGEDILDDPLPTQKIRQRAKRMMKTSKVLKRKKIDRQQTATPGGASTDDTLRCQICHYKTVNDLKFLEHLKAHGATRKRYNCDMCKFRTDGKNKMIWHVRKHSRIKSKSAKPYSCSICYSTVATKTDLARHLRVHTGEKPFSCDICNKKFGRKSNLLLHLRIHSGQRPFSCHVCNKTFSRRYNLLEHSAVHMKIKPNTCDVCKKKCRTNKELERHKDSGCYT